ncbi:hypothetical protein [Bradyrhizobium sp. SZCCHNRI2010]|uniref:hypothetical protein n=1 Tax=Bradyrhizobium sp. SZCCHNRI2010 TaxID=3057283 RepID=UPI0028EDC1EA|nr:hypothetical protein [Bradyrhizobium sp. SZCCHNRI2010]
MIATLKQIAWHEAGHAVVAWDQGFTVVLVSIQKLGENFGRTMHTPAADCSIRSERERENIVAMGGWAAEHRSGEAADVTYDGSDLSCILSRIAEHAPDRMAIELGSAEQEAERIISANIDRVEQLADELLKRQELTDPAEILRIIEGS